jgi:gliding motility-associated-like protein
LIVVLPAAENCLCADVVLPVLNHTVNQTPLVVCDALPFELGVDSVGGFQYQWLNSTGIGCATCATTVVQPVGMLQTYTLTESNNGCVVEHRFFVTFGATATLTVNNNSICAGESITLVATPADAQFLWSGPGVQTQGTNVQTLQPDSTATYAVTITLSNGCTASALATALVFQPDTVQLPLITACDGSTITVFDATVLAANGVYSKLLTTVQGCDSLLLQPVSVLPKIMTNAAVTFCEGDTVFLFGNFPVSTSIEVCRDTISANGCDSTHCIMATAIPLPVLQVLDTIFATLGDTITLQGPSGYVQYLWTPAPVPPCSNCSSIDVIPDTTGYLQYGLEVKDGQNCGAETLYRVVIFPPCDAYKVLIPNAFTPNGDGANDQFRPITTEGGEVIGKLTIYNRWGQKLFESRNNVFWDGTIDGQAATSDVYVYLIEVQCGELIASRVGEVTLIR